MPTVFNENVLDIHSFFYHSLFCIFTASPRSSADSSSWHVIITRLFIAKGSKSLLSLSFLVAIVFQYSSLLSMQVLRNTPETLLDAWQSYPCLHCLLATQLPFCNEINYSNPLDHFLFLLVPYMEQRAKNGQLSLLSSNSL